MRASAHVGRIGTLAVALGIGMGIGMGIGGAGTAWASPAESPSSPEGTDSASQTVTNDGGTTRTPRRTRTQSSDAVDLPGSSDSAPATDTHVAPASAAQRVTDNSPENYPHTAPTSRKASALQDRLARAVSATSVSPAPAYRGVLRFLNAVKTTESSVIAPAPLLAVAAPASSVIAPASSVIAPAPAAASGLLGSVFASLAGAGLGSGGPLQTPLAWAILAAARRQYGWPGITGVPPAPAAVPTATKYVGVPSSSTGVVTGRIIGADAAKHALTYSTSGTSSKGFPVTVNASTGEFTYTPSPAARHAAAKIGALATDKVDTFTITVSDGFGGTLNVPVTVKIGPKNTAPTLGAPTIGDPNGFTGVVTGAVTATDLDTDTLTYTVAAKPLKGSVTINGSGGFTYTPTVTARKNATKVGASITTRSDTFTVAVKDGYGGNVTQKITVNIAPYDNANPVAGQPTVNAPNVFTGKVTGVIPVTDTEYAKLTSTATTKPTRGTVTFNGSGGFFYTPTYAARQNAATEPTDTFTVTITDGYGGSTAPVEITVDIAAIDAASQGVDTSGWLDWTQDPYSGKRPTTDWVPQIPSVPTPPFLISLISSIGGVGINSSSGAYVSYTAAQTNVPLDPLAAFNITPVVAAYYLPPQGVTTLSPFTSAIYLSQAQYQVSTGSFQQIIEFTATSGATPVHGVLTVNSYAAGFNIYVLAAPTNVWPGEYATLAAIAEQLVVP